MRLPSGVFVSGVGSLPHVDPERAVEFVAAHASEVPFWPQLPRRSPREGMIEQVLPTGVPLQREAGRVAVAARDRDALLAALHAAPAQLDEGCAAGLFALRRAIDARRFPHAVAWKAQIVGPVTLGASLIAGADPALLDGELRAALTRRVIALAGWLIDTLPADRPRILVLDEPCLGVAPWSRYLAADDAPIHDLCEALGAIRARGAVAGIHCCSPFPWPLLPRLDPDLLSFDATHAEGSWIADRHLHAWLASGRLLAPGLVPTTGEAPSALLARQLRPVHSACRLVTAACGLGLTDERYAAAAFTAAAAAAARLRVP